MATIMRKCEEYGTGFAVIPHGGPLRRFCSRACKRKSPDAKRVEQEYVQSARGKEVKQKYTQSDQGKMQIQKQLYTKAENTARPESHNLAGSNQAGETEGKGSAARYLTQLYILLRTARRQNNRRVVIALRNLIGRKRGTA